MEVFSVSFFPKQTHSNPDIMMLHTIGNSYVIDSVDSIIFSTGSFLVVDYTLGRGGMDGREIRFRFFGSYVGCHLDC